MSMPTLTYEAAAAQTAALGRWSDYLELAKPKIALLVLLTVAAAAVVANWGPPDAPLLAHTLVGTALVAASASAFNQWLEREPDARMARTELRPLPAGRLAARQVSSFGMLTLAAGLAQLGLFVRWQTLVAAGATWFVYVCLYTPLKSRTSANTAVGAVAGALPVLLGWTAVGAPLDVRALCLFTIVFLWQFPHFMAIAWIYRHDYAAAGMQMLTVVDASGRRAGAQAVVAALALLPVSLLPAVLHAAGGVYFGWALALGLVQLAAAAAFLLRLDESSAKLLLTASLIYLPAVMGLLIMGPIV